MMTTTTTTTIMIKIMSDFYQPGRRTNPQADRLEMFKNKPTSDYWFVNKLWLLFLRNFKEILLKAETEERALSKKRKKK